jgi:hypothetical protein
LLLNLVAAHMMVASPAQVNSIFQFGSPVTESTKILFGRHAQIRYLRTEALELCAGQSSEWLARLSLSDDKYKCTRMNPSYRQCASKTFLL